MLDYDKSKKSKHSHKKKLNSTMKELNIIYILPIIFVIAIIPLIVKMHEYKTGLGIFDWFSKDDNYFDFFLYYKMIFLNLSSLMMVVLLLFYKLIKKEKLCFTYELVPLVCYILLAFLSSILSEYRSFSFTGVFEQFETVFSLMAYGILLYYAYIFVQTERDIKYILYALLSTVLTLTIICLTQLFGHDFFRTDFGWNLISTLKYADYKDNFNFASQSGYSYLTLFNPNYIGMYVSLLLPIFLFMSIYFKKLWLRVLFLLGTLGLVLCLYGSKSSSGIVGITLSMFLGIVLFWKNIIKYWKIVISTVIVVAIAIFVFNAKTNYINYQIEKITNYKKSSVPILKRIQTNDDNVTIEYNGNLLKSVFIYDASSGFCTFLFQDDQDVMVPFNQEAVNGPVIIIDERFPGFVFEPMMFEDNTIGFSVTIDGKPWYFTNQYKDNTYYYLNNFGKYTKIITAPSSVFTGYETYGSGRGYIWSRTIPLLKDRILLGAGADNFVFAFPQSDYVNLYNYGFEGQLLTKPHSLYLQIAVQTGVISLIAFLVLYGMYFISSIQLYIKGIFNSIYSVVGASILIGTTGYMICAIANDSSVTVAPVFWSLLGIGLAMNQKVKREQISNSVK